MKKKTQQWFQHLKHQLFQSVFSGVIFVLTVIVTITSLILIGSEVLVGRDVIAADAADRDKFVYGSGENAIGIDIANLNKLLSTNNSYQLTANVWDTLIDEIKNLGNVVNNQKTIIENITNSTGSDTDTDTDTDTDQIYAELNTIYSMINEINININQLSGKAATPTNIPPTLTYFEGAFDNDCNGINHGFEDRRPADQSCENGQQVLKMKKRTNTTYIRYIRTKTNSTDWHYTFTGTELTEHDYCRLAGVGGNLMKPEDEIKVIGNRVSFIHNSDKSLRFTIACLNKEKPNVFTYPPSQVTSSLDLWSKWTCKAKPANCPDGYRSIGTRGSSIWDGASCGFLVDWDERYCVKENKTMVKDGGNCIAGYTFAGTTITIKKGTMTNGRCIETRNPENINMDPNTGERTWSEKGK